LLRVTRTVAAVGADAAGARRDDHLLMARSYAVTWRDDRGLSIGKLVLGAASLTLDGSRTDGAPSSLSFDYADVDVRTGTRGERLRGRRALVVERTGSAPVLIASLDGPGTALELAEHLVGAPWPQ
jgi:hypothetical protein